MARPPAVQEAKVQGIWLREIARQLGISLNSGTGERDRYFIWDLFN